MNYLNTKEVSQKFKVSRVSVHSWLKKGLFPNAKQLEGVKVGRGEAWVIPGIDVENFQKPKRGKPFNKSPSKATLAKRAQRELEKKKRIVIERDTFSTQYLILIKECVKMARYYDYCKDNARAFAILEPVWSDLDAFPAIDDLSDRLACEILIVSGSILSNHALYTQQNNYFEKAQNALTRARELAEDINDCELLADAEKQISVSYWREGRFENAVVYAGSALSHFSESDQHTKDVCLLVKTNLIILYFRINDFNECVTLIKDNEPFVEMCENEWVKTTFYGHAGLFYSMSNNYDAAINYFQKSLTYAVSTKNRTYEGTLFNNISMMYLRLGQLSEAHSYATRANGVFAELGLDLTLAQVLETQASIYIAESRIQKALLVINEAIDILCRGENYPQVIEALWTRTRIYFLTDEKRAAILQFNEILNICQKHLPVAVADSYIEKFNKCVYLETGSDFYEKSDNYREYLLDNALAGGGGLVKPTAKILGISHQNTSALIKRFPALAKKHNVPTRSRTVKIAGRNKSDQEKLQHIKLKSSNLNYLGLLKGMLVAARPTPLENLDLSKPIIFKDLDGDFFCGFLIHDFDMWAFGNGLGEIEHTYFDNEIKLTAQIVEFFDEKLDDFRPISDLGI